jgi:hypothetical protein
MNHYGREEQLPILRVKDLKEFFLGSIFYVLRLSLVGKVALLQQCPLLLCFHWFSPTSLANYGTELLKKQGIEVALNSITNGLISVSCMCGGSGEGCLGGGACVWSMVRMYADDGALTYGGWSRWWRWHACM